jgi:hypothetical protein
MSDSGGKPVKWLVLFYLAGDLDSPRSLSIKEDLSEILSAGKDPDNNMHVVVQFDSLGNCFRYEVESDACKLQDVKKTMEWPKVRERDKIDEEEDEDQEPQPPEGQTIESMSAKDLKALEEKCQAWMGRQRDRQKRRKEEERLWQEQEEKQGTYFTQEFTGDPAKDVRIRYRPVEVLGRINSGAAEELENFIIWGLGQKEATKVALVVAGKDRLDPILRDSKKRRLPQVFTLCRDDSTRDHLSFVEFSRAIRNALRRSQKRTKLDILAIDSAQSQFLELAHELEDSVEVLIGAQTPIPRKGWNYRQVLKAWRHVLVEEMSRPQPPEHERTHPTCTICPSGPADPHTVAVAKRLIDAIHTSYTPGAVTKESESETYAISAIDITRLPDMTANFDSACMTFMHSLGEGIMWEGRQILREFLDKHLRNNQYDCGIFFEGLRRAMEIKARCPVFDWLIWDLKQHGIGEHNGRFWNYLFNSIKSPPEDLPIPEPARKGTDGVPFSPVHKVDGKPYIPIDLLREAIGEPWKQDNTRDRKCGVDNPQLAKQEKLEKSARDEKRLDLIRSEAGELLSTTTGDASARVDKILDYFRKQEDKRKAEGEDQKHRIGAELVDQFRSFTKDLLTTAIEDPSDETGAPPATASTPNGQPMAKIDVILAFLEQQDKWLEEIILRGPDFLSDERWRSFEQMKITRQTALRLHKQAKGLIHFFPPRSIVKKREAEAKAAEAAEAKPKGKGTATEAPPAQAAGPPAAAADAIAEATKTSPLVLAAACTDPEQAMWWTGLSLYRPHDLDTLMNPEYRDFSFHRKVHWSALLGAIYLIEASPPLAMWRLISSLITRGSGSTRRDLLEHLSGEKSVIWGMENQFRILAPAPVITLTLEHRETIRNRGSRLLRPPSRTGSATPSDSQADDHIYLVRLESHRQGAVIFEHASRVRAVTLQGVLANLGEVLDSTTAAERSFARLTSLGGILGDEVLQELARALESEQRAIRKEVQRRNGIRKCLQCGRSDATTARPGHGHLPGAAGDDSRDVDVHLQLHIPRELMHHPWELMSIHDRMLGFNFAIGRRVFMDSTSFRGDREREQGTIRPLLVVPRYQGANDLKEIELELEEVRDCFEQLAASRGQIVMFDRKEDILAGDDANFLNLRRKLGDGRYDIIHFAGHGQFVADDPEASAWVLADGTLTAAEIRNALRNHPAPPWLVYANACKAGLSARNHASPYLGEVHGLATAFIGNGVAAYVGPLWDLGDGVARRIAVDFYKELLLQGATLGEALLRAKRGVKDRFDREREQQAKDEEARKQQARRKGSGNKSGNASPAPADTTTPAGDTPPVAKLSTHDISGAGVVLFGDASGELIQALAGTERVTIQESGSSVHDRDREGDRDRDREQNHQHTHQTT